MLEKTNLKHYLSTVSLVGVFSVFLAVFALPIGVQAQECAESLRFSHDVDELEADYGALGDINQAENTYAWSFGQSCSNESCLSRTGTDITVSNMFDVAGSNNTTVYLYSFNGSDPDFSNLATSTSKEIRFGNAYYEEDRDGDGILDQNEEIGCEGDPCPDCSDDDENGGGDDEGGGDGSTAGLVNCGDPGSDGELQEGEMCGYEDLINLVSIVIQWLIGILVLVATLLFTYAGFLYLLADGNSDQAKEAKDIFTNVAFGFTIVLVSVLFITTVVTMFTSGSWESTWMDVVPLPELGADIDRYISGDDMIT